MFLCSKEGIFPIQIYAHSPASYVEGHTTHSHDTFLGKEVKGEAAGVQSNSE